MSLPSVVNEARANEDKRSLEDILAELQAFGRVVLGQYNSGDMGWRCTVNLHVMAVGSTLTVASQFNHGSAREAVMVCLGLTHDAIKQLGGS